MEGLDAGSGEREARGAEERRRQLRERLTATGGRLHGRVGVLAADCTGAVGCMLG